jgi:hypothetical protein
VRRNECLDATRNELHAVGITHTVAYGGKHLKIKFKLGYRNETYVCAVSRIRVQIFAVCCGATKQPMPMRRRPNKRGVSQCLTP